LIYINSAKKFIQRARKVARLAMEPMVLARLDLKWI